MAIIQPLLPQPVQDRIYHPKSLIFPETSLIIISDSSARNYRPDSITFDPPLSFSNHI